MQADYRTRKAAQTAADAFASFLGYGAAGVVWGSQTHSLDADRVWFPEVRVETSALRLSVYRATPELWGCRIELFAGQRRPLKLNETHYDYHAAIHNAINRLAEAVGEDTALELIPTDIAFDCW